MDADTSSQEFFEARYSADPDPWNFATSAYEVSRYDATIQALLGQHYARAFEPGCSIGILTLRLAELCASVEAIEISPTAAEMAINRCSRAPNVHISQGKLPEDCPAGAFDLIVLSEIGYYFEPDSLIGVTDSLVRRLTPGGTLLAVHWLGKSPDHKISGDTVHSLINRTPGLACSLAARHGVLPQESFLLERWVRL